jgi:hypothetical protein
LLGGGFAGQSLFCFDAGLLSGFRLGLLDVELVLLGADACCLCVLLLLNRGQSLTFCL